MKEGVVFFILLLVFLLIFTSGIERLVWAQSNSYPEMLVNKHIKLNDENLIKMREACGEPLESKYISPSSKALRCGLLWPLTTVYITN